MSSPLCGNEVFTSQRAMKELLRMKTKGTVHSVFMWACSDEALGWAA